MKTLKLSGKNKVIDVDRKTGECVFEKPTVKLVGADGNVFNLIGLAQRALNQAGFKDHADVFVKRAFNAGSYDNVIQIIGEYCEIE